MMTRVLMGGDEVKRCVYAWLLSAVYKIHRAILNQIFVGDI
jgi:hypothetical protein